MMRARTRAIGSEQGAVFVQVGISLFVLMAFNVFVLDYGMMWIGRASGAERRRCWSARGGDRLGYDDFDDPPSSNGLAAAERTGTWLRRTSIWQQAGTPVVTFNCPSGVAGRCVSVDVYRDGENGSTPMPTLFGPDSWRHQPGREGNGDGFAGKRQRHQLSQADRLRRRLDRTASTDQPIQQLRRNDRGTAGGTRDSYTPPSALAIRSHHRLE